MSKNLEKFNFLDKKVFDLAKNCRNHVKNNGMPFVNDPDGWKEVLGERCAFKKPIKSLH
jgi:hypothetical protein